jgi:HEAT repeat protein
MPALIAALKEPDGGMQAAEALRAIGVEAKAAVPALIEALKEQNVYRRVSAAEALWTIDRNPAAAAALVEFLKERKKPGHDLIYAARSLWQINKNPAAVAALIEVLKGGANRYGERAVAAEALWQSNRSPAAVPVLIESESVHALAQVGLEGKAAVAALTDALKDEDEGVRNGAARWLKKIGPRSAKELTGK